jgi:hypothetical protein
MAKSREVLSGAQVSVLKTDAEIAVWNTALTGTPQPIAAWKRKFHRGPFAQNRNEVLLQKWNDGGELGANLAICYLNILADAAGHLANNLAHALGFRQVVGSPELRWIKERIEEFVQEMCSAETIAEWFTIAAFDDVLGYAPGLHSHQFHRLVAHIVENTQPPFDRNIYMHVDGRLRVALVVFGGRKVNFKQLAPQHVLTLETLKGLKSCTPGQAAALLQISPRSIRTLAAQRRLARSKNGRIVCDDKLVAEYNRRHSPRSD